MRGGIPPCETRNNPLEFQMMSVCSLTARHASVAVSSLQLHHKDGQQHVHSIRGVLSELESGNGRNPILFAPLSAALRSGPQIHIHIDVIPSKHHSSVHLNTHTHTHHQTDTRCRSSIAAPSRLNCYAHTLTSQPEDSQPERAAVRLGRCSLLLLIERP